MSMAKAHVVDFSGVQDRGAFSPKRVPAGDYAAKITKVEDGESKKDQSFQYIFTIKLSKFSQNSYPYYCKLQENQLWKLRNLAVAAGLNVPKKRMKFDPNKVVGKEVGVTMEDDEYEGKLKSVVAAVFPVSELADGGEDLTSDEDDFDEGAAPVMAGDDEDADEAPAAAEDSDDDAADEAPKKKKKDKKKKKKSEDEDLEELDISDV
jgi:hypothetical protein